MASPGGGRKAAAPGPAKPCSGLSSGMLSVLEASYNHERITEKWQNLLTGRRYIPFELTCVIYNLLLLISILLKSSAPKLAEGIAQEVTNHFC